MINSRLIVILRSFSKDELKEFEKFAGSPYFSSGRNVLPVLKYLKKYSPQYDNKEALTLEKIYSSLNAKAGTMTPKNSGLIRKHLSELSIMAEKFMAVSGFMKDKNNFRISLLRELGERKIYSLFEKEYENTLSDMGKTGFDPEKLDFESNLAYQKCLFHLHKNELKKYFPMYCETIDIQFLRALLDIYKASAALLTFKQNYNFNTSQSLAYNIPEIINSGSLLEIIKEKYPAYLTCCEIYYLIFKAGNEPDNINNIVILREKFLKIIDKFSHHEKFEIFRFIESFYMRLEKESVPVLGYQRVKLYKEMLDKNVYSHNPDEDFSELTFNNFLFHFLNVEDIKYAEEFLENNLDKLSKPVRKNVYNLSKAFINWHKKNYEPALQYLSDVKSEYIPSIKNEIYYLKTILFFELSHFENCFYNIDSHNHYLRNNEENSEIDRQRYINFNQYARKLANIKSGTAKEDIDNLIYEINKTSPIVNSVWLLEKAGELEGKQKK